MQCFTIFLTLDFVLNLFLRCCFSDFVILVHFLLVSILSTIVAIKSINPLPSAEYGWSHIFDHISSYYLRFGFVRGARSWSSYLRNYQYDQEEGQDVVLP